MNEGAEEILSFIDKHGIINKDKYLKPANTAKKKTVAVHKKQSRERLDLHGLTTSEASIRLRNTIHRCRERGINEVLVIHGKGFHSNMHNGPVLKEMVRKILEEELCTSIRDFRTALPRDGGEGATVVYLR